MPSSTKAVQAAGSPSPSVGKNPCIRPGGTNLKAEAADRKEKNRNAYQPHFGMRRGGWW
jgi:hypothetical protein